MRRLYLRIYLAVVASLAAFALVAGLMWHSFGQPWWSEEAFGTVARNVLPPAAAPAAEQQAARTQAVTLLTAPTIDRTAIERLRTEQIALADQASKRIAQALADAADVMTPDQRRKVGDRLNWLRRFHGGDEPR